MRKILVIFCLLTLTGCGSEKNGDRGSYSTKVVSAYQDLPQCNENRRGHLYYVESSATFFACKPIGWEAVNVGNSVYWKMGCIQEMGGILLTYEAVVFQNGDSFTSCEVFDAISRTQSSYSEYHSSHSSAGQRLECGVGHLTSSGGGFYTVATHGNGVFNVNYENYSSGSNTTYTYASSSCVSTTYE